MRKRRELEPAERLVARKADGRPKREMSPFGHIVSEYVVSIRCEGHGVEYRPKVTENGLTERGNPPSALWRWNIVRKAGAGDQAASLGGVGCPKKPMPHCNGEDMQT